MPSVGNVSVVVPVKNGAQFIQATLDSILKQTYTNLEVIVVDDGSTDQTRTIVQQFVEHDSRVSIVANKGNSGHEGARNYGVSLTRGAWVAECDADDVWLPEKLDRQISFIQSWSYSIKLLAIGTAGYNTNGAGKIISTLDSCPNTVDEFIHLHENSEPFTLHHSSVIYRKDVFEDLGGYRLDYVGAEDTELFSRMAERGVVISIPEPLFHYRKHMGSFSLAKTTIQMYNFMRIRENIQRRRMGYPEKSYNDFVHDLTVKLTPSEKKRLVRKQRGKYLYRMGAIRAANGHYMSGLFYLSAASLFDFNMVSSGLERRVRPPRKFGAEH